MKRIIILCAVSLAIVACGNNTTKKTTENQATETSTTVSTAGVTEVLYFHGKQRCITCNAIERLTKEVVDSLKSDKIVMKVIDISQTENQAIADKYEVTWSSLIVEHNGKAVNLTDLGFSYAKNEPEVFKGKLAEELAKITQ